MHAEFPERLIAVVKRTCESAIFVLLVMLAHDGPRGASPAVATIAREAGCSERKVYRDLRALVRCGILVACPQRRADGGNLPTLYRVASQWV